MAICIQCNKSIQKEGEVMEKQATIRCDKETAREIARIKIDLRARNADEVLQQLIKVYRKNGVEKDGLR